MKYLPFVTKRKRPVVSIVRLEGVIFSARGVRRGRLSETSVAPLLENAFRKGKPKAVALEINSPGGSPVQSSLIAARIRRISEETEIPVYAFVEDVAASGGYWIAVAANEIYVDPCSIVGSIGVISTSFGFQELLQRVGIERRIHTAGEDKSMLDPFLPETPQDLERLKEVQGQLHQAFIDQVKDRRAGKLNGEDLFTGNFWTGERAIALGLVDDIGHLVPKMKDKLGDRIKFQRYGPKRQIIPNFGAEFLESALLSLEEERIWARYRP